MAPGHKEAVLKGTVTRATFAFATADCTFSVLLVKEDDRWRVGSFTVSEWRSRLLWHTG
ncbi:MAG TPA: hypothetical protein VFA26_03295 [Gemmataceae bacterium]|nr:hypothetical protein [Gemmataceae bacterium]